MEGSIRPSAVTKDLKSNSWNKILLLHRTRGCMREARCYFQEMSLVECCLGEQALTAGGGEKGLCCQARRGISSLGGSKNIVLKGALYY